MSFNNEQVLVTGANGFAAAHVVSLLLKKGYTVRGTVRTQKKADQMLNLYSQYKDKLEFVIVEDVSKEGAFDGKLDGISGIFHVASPLNLVVKTSNKADFLDPALHGTLEILKAASKVPTVKRVVITASFSGLMDSSKDSTHVYTEEDWNPITYEEALVTPHAVIAYQASKTFAEKAAFEFVKTYKPQFDIVTLCPVMIYGPISHHIDKLAELNETARWFYDYVSGKKKVDQMPFDTFVDVRDVAKAHVLAYENPIASNQRYLLSNGNYDWQEVVDLAHREFPNQTKADVGQPGTHLFPIGLRDDNSKSISHLGLTYTPKEETFRDTIAQLIQFEKEGK